MQTSTTVFDLITSTGCITVGSQLESVNKEFADFSQSFLAVVDGERFVGLCSCGEIRSKLSNRFGFELFGRDPVEKHLLKAWLIVEFQATVEQVLERAFSRPEFIYHDDLVVVDGQNKYVGLISVARLVQLQQSILEDKIVSIERHERELSQKNDELEASYRHLNQLNFQLEMTRDEALESTRLKSEFLANMSHEIRTPMNGVVGMVDLLMDTDLSSEQRFFAETIRNSAESLISIINDILDFSKIEADRIDLIHEDFVLADLVDSCVQQVSSRASKKSIRLFVDLQRDLASCYVGDSVRLQQVLVNLLGNAVKFTDAGEICLYVRLEGSSKSAACGRESRLRFTVEDSGIGIARENLCKLFDPFVQVDGSPKRRQDGSGLGLSICQRLSTLMAGSIEVESELGTGSKFCFVVPVRTSTQTCCNEQLRTTVAANIHFVTSNQKLREMFERACQRFGAEVHFYDCFEGVNKLFDDHLLLIDAFEYSCARVTCFVQWLERLRYPKHRIVVLMKVNDPFRKELNSFGIEHFQYYPFRMDTLFSVFQKIDSPERFVEQHPLVSAANVEDCGLKILLVEDNLTNQKLATILLDKLGHTVDRAENGVIALKKLSKISYDCILMDCMMPEMDGFECTHHIRNDEVSLNREVYIIAVTAKAMKGDREKCLASGMDDYVSKPLNRIALVDALNRCVEQLLLK